MKKELLIFFFIFLSISLVCAQDPADPDAPFSEGDAEKIKTTIDKIPVNPDGSVNTEEFKPFKSKAEERIETIDAVAKPISRFVFGIELGLSWKFFVVLLLWIFLIALVATSLSNLVSLSMLISLPSGIIISSLLIRLFKKTFLSMYDAVIVTWWKALILIVLLVIATFIYSIFMKFFGEKIREKKKKQTEMRREMKQETLEATTNIQLKAQGIQPQK